MQENTSGVHVWLVLMKAHRSVQAEALRSLEASPLCPSDFAVLEALLHKGPLPIQIIGHKVLLTSGSTTAAVDRLEKQGLVERRNHPEDRRSKIVHLTAAGKALIEGAFAEHERDMERVASRLDPDERNTLIQLLKKLGNTQET